MAANSPIRYIVLAKKIAGNDQYQIPLDQRPKKEELLIPLVDVTHGRHPILISNGHTKTYSVDTQQAKAEVNETLEWLLLDDKPKNAVFYFQIHEAAAGHIIQIDLFVDGIQHPLPLAEGHTIGRWTFVDCLEFVLEHSGYTQVKQKASIATGPKTVWATQPIIINKITGKESRGTGGIAKEDIPITRDDKPDSETFGRLSVDESKIRPYEWNDTTILLPHIVLDYDMQTKQLLGATLYFPEKKSTILHEQSIKALGTKEDQIDRGNIQQIRLTAEDINTISYSLDPQQSMADIFQAKIPAHVYSMGLFGDVTKTSRGAFILQKIDTHLKKITITSHLAINAATREKNEASAVVFNDLAELIKLKQQSTTVLTVEEEKRLNEGLESLKQQQISISDFLEKPDSLSTVSMGDIPSEEQESEKKAQLAEQYKRKQEAEQKVKQQTYSFDIYAEASINETNEYHIINTIIVVDRQTGMSETVDLDQPSLQLAINNAIINLIFSSSQSLTLDQKAVLKFNVMMACITKLILEEAKKTQNDSGLIPLYTDLNSKPLFNEHGMVALSTIKKLETISNQTVQKKSVSVLISNALIALCSQRECRINELSIFTNVVFEDEEKGRKIARSIFIEDAHLPKKLMDFAAFMRHLCNEKSYAGLERIFTGLDDAVANPRIAGVINVGLIVALEALRKQLRKFKDSEIEQAISNALTDLNKEYTANIKTAIISFATLTFTNNATPRQESLDDFLQLIGSLAKANKISDKAQAALAVLSQEKEFVRVGGLINPKWITALHTLEEQLPDPNVKALILPVVSNLKAAYQAEIELGAEKITSFDFTNDKQLEQACQTFFELISHMANESEISLGLKKILSELELLLNSPRSEGIIKLRLIMTVSALIMAKSRNSNIQETANQFLGYLKIEYERNLETTQEDVQKQWQEKQKKIQETVKKMWTDFLAADDVMRGGKASGIQVRIKEQKQRKEFGFETFQQQLTAFLSDSDNLTLLMQGDRPTRDTVLGLIDRMIADIRTLSKYEVSFPFFPQYPHEQFQSQMMEKCKAAKRLCYAELPLVEEASSGEVEEVGMRRSTLRPSLHSSHLGSSSDSTMPSSLSSYSSSSTPASETLSAPPPSLPPVSFSTSSSSSSSPIGSVVPKLVVSTASHASTESFSVEGENLIGIDLNSSFALPPLPLTAHTSLTVSEQSTAPSSELSEHPADDKKKVVTFANEEADPSKEQPEDLIDFSLELPATSSSASDPFAIFASSSQPTASSSIDDDLLNGFASSSATTSALSGGGTFSVNWQAFSASHISPQPTSLLSNSSLEPMPVTPSHPIILGSPLTSPPAPLNSFSSSTNSSSMSNSLSMPSRSAPSSSPSMLSSLSSSSSEMSSSSASSSSSSMPSSSPSSSSAMSSSSSPVFFSPPPPPAAGPPKFTLSSQTKPLSNSTPAPAALLEEINKAGDKGVAGFNLKKVEIPPNPEPSAGSPPKSTGIPLADLMAAEMRKRRQSIKVNSVTSLEVEQEEEEWSDEEKKEKVNTPGSPSRK